MGFRSHSRSRRAVAFLVAALVIAAGTGMAAQLGFFTEREPSIRNMKYDGRFAFARIRYETGPGGYYYCGLPAWAHGYASCRGGERAEESLMKIVTELSYLNPHIDESVVMALDDPELFKYPVSYMAEPGFWTITPKETAAFRAYLLKGGFVIFDDFRADGDPRAGGGWENFEANMRLVLPQAKFIDLDPSLPIFHSFFEINSFDIVPQSYDRGPAHLPGRVRGQRPEEAPDGRRQLQHRYLRLLGVLGHRLQAHRRIERGLQDRRELPDVRPHALDARRELQPRTSPSTASEPREPREPREPANLENFEMFQDLRLAFRLLWRDKAFTLTAAATLAVCIGANIALYTVVDNVLLRPLHVPRSDQILLIYNSYPKAGVDHASATVPDYYDRLRDMTVFDEQAMFQTRDPSLDVNGAPERIHTMHVTPSFLRLYRLRLRRDAGLPTKKASSARTDR